MHATLEWAVLGRSAASKRGGSLQTGLLHDIKGEYNALEEPGKSLELTGVKWRLGAGSAVPLLREYTSGRMLTSPPCFQLGTLPCTFVKISSVGTNMSGGCDYANTFLDTGHTRITKLIPGCVLQVQCPTCGLGQFR